MNVEIINIKGIKYLINFDIMTIKVFNEGDKREVHKYLVQRHEEKNKYNMPEKYQKIYTRIENIEEDNKKKKDINK